MNTLTRRANRSLFYKASTIALSMAALVSLLPSSRAQEVNPYEGFKVPPLEISSETPYDYKFVEVLGSQIAYVEAGEGDPILFLHGQPTSSYLWRNIMPHLEDQGRVIAPDNIGFGQSDQPELDYTFGDHYRYLDAFIKQLDLKNVTLVVHDWGSGLGLHYARLNPDNVKAIVTMEAIIAPLIPAESYEALPTELGNFFRMVRDPENGRKLLIEDNFFVEGALPGFIVRPLAEEAHDVYRAPFPTEASRIQVNQWPNEMPIGRQPQETHDIVTAYNAWLEETEIPWLFLYATPGALNPPETAEYWAARAQNIETVYIGAGLHYVQEDQPYAIGRAISDWYRRINQSED
ncbi:MAG: haloalkane dehalogenase [Leptolyngbya sp. SIO1D8]|nr:haloalkane dehalogenase [Leptolyngbya sp. SIO1D8]